MDSPHQFGVKLTELSFPLQEKKMIKSNVSMATGTPKIQS